MQNIYWLASLLGINPVQLILLGIVIIGGSVYSHYDNRDIENWEIRKYMKK